MPRATRNQVLMSMAWAVAERSTCNRLHVGAVIAREGRVISSGYNGNLVGMNHCEHDALSPEPCTSAVHAEANAILFAARYGTAVEGAQLFTTHEPCLDCAKMIVNAGISEVIYAVDYRKHEGLNLLLKAPSVGVGQYFRGQVLQVNALPKS